MYNPGYNICGNDRFWAISRNDQTASLGQYSTDKLQKFVPEKTVALK